MRNQLQHDVPKFLLRQFGKGKKDHFRVMDKQTGRKFSFSASKKALISVAAEYGMYDFEFMGQPVSIEPNLASLESKAAESIARLSREEKFDLADPMERATLACQRGRGAEAQGGLIYLVRKRFFTDRLAGLDERARAGRPRAHPPSDER